jgi:hypothetical protein
VTVTAAAADDDRQWMLEITEDQMIELATARVDRGVDRLEQVYSWDVERVLVGMRAALAVAASVAGVLLTAIFREAARMGPSQILIALAALGLSTGVAARQSAKLGRLYGNYLESLRLFAVVQRMVDLD